MWQFASMLQFTDIPFSSESALRSIILLVSSLTSALISFGRASNAPWVEFLPAPIAFPPDRMSDDAENERDALDEAAASKGNVVLIALSKCKDAARNKASFIACRTLPLSSPHVSFDPFPLFRPVLRS